MWTASFWKALAERAVKSFSASLASLLVADGTDLLNTDWGDRLSVAGMAALVSALLTIAAGSLTGTASLVRAEVPSDNVVAENTEQGVVAGEKSPLPNGTPVEVVSSAGP